MQNPSNAEKDIIDLIGLLNEKANLLNNILELTNQQTDVIKLEKMDKLDNRIKAKQLNIDNINKIDKKFIRKFNEIKHQYHVEKLQDLDVNHELLLELKGVTEEVHAIISQIFEKEKLNKELISKNFQEIKDRLKNIKKGKKVTQNYYKKTTQTGGYFIDQKK